MLLITIYYLFTVYTYSYLCIYKLTVSSKHQQITLNAQPRCKTNYCFVQTIFGKYYPNYSKLYISHISKNRFLLAYNSSTMHNLIINQVIILFELFFGSYYSIYSCTIIAAIIDNKSTTFCCICASLHVWNKSLIQISHKEPQP